MTPSSSSISSSTSSSLSSSPPIRAESPWNHVLTKITAAQLAVVFGGDFNCTPLQLANCLPFVNQTQATRSTVQVCQSKVIPKHSRASTTAFVCLSWSIPGDISCDPYGTPHDTPHVTSRVHVASHVITKFAWNSSMMILTWEAPSNAMVCNLRSGSCTPRALPMYSCQILRVTSHVISHGISHRIFCGISHGISHRIA